MDPLTPKVYRFGEFTFVMRTGVLFRGDDPVGHLTKMPKEVLVFILNNTGPKGGTLFSRDDLIDKIWGVDVHMAPGAFDKHISAIRTALGDEEDDRKILETVPRQGFRLNLGVTFLYEEPENLRELSQDHTTTTPSEFQTSLSNAELALTQDGTLSETQSDLASGVKADERDRDLDFSSRQENVLGTQTSDKSEASSPGPATVDESLSILGNQFTFVVYTAIGVVALVILGFSLSEKLDHPNRRLDYIEMSLILGGIAYYLRRLYLFRKFDLIKDRAYKAVQQVQIFWTLLLISWFGLYGILLVKSDSHPLYALATLLNNSNSLMLLLCYSVLNEPTISRGKNGDALAGAPLLRKKALIGAAAVLILALLEELVLLKFPSKVDTTNIVVLFDLFSGTVGAIAMGLFISRLHSRLLGESTLLPIVGVILYLYVAIQPFYFILNQPAENSPPSLPAPWPMVLSLGPLIIGLAFILKIIMFLYVTEIIRRNRLLFYMINAKRVYTEVEVQWREFKPR
jgi:DNA-binding winged helix-turn-helix (wHTH) protein